LLRQVKVFIKNINKIINKISIIIRNSQNKDKLEEDNKKIDKNKDKNIFRYYVNNNKKKKID
jgi:hypothetical protein